jgi:hypothetical protein
MMKFNQIVRASALSLTLVGGLGLAGHAFAYDQADLDDATAAVETAGAPLLQALGDMASLFPEPIGPYDDVWTLYYIGYDGCTGGGGPNADPWAINDCREMWNEWKPAADDAQSRYNDAAYAYDQAVFWLNTVSSDQNGQHGIA